MSVGSAARIFPCWWGGLLQISPLQVLAAAGSMQLHDIGLSLLALVCEVLGTISGFGSSTFFVPVASIFEGIYFVLALTSLLHCFSNISKLIFFGRYLERRPLLRMLPPFVVMSAVGAVLSGRVPTLALTRCLGVMLIVIPVFSLKARALSKVLPRSLAFGLSGLSGLSTGLIGTGGAIRGVALTLLGLEKNSFVAVSAAIDLGGDAVRAVIYLRSGYMDWAQWYYLPALLVSAFAGAWVGKRALACLRQDLFEKVVAAFVLVSGLFLIISP